jgi:WD40 repeat protein
LALAPSGEWLVTEGAGATLSVHRLPEATLERSVPIPQSGLERLELAAAGDRLAAQPRDGGPFVIRTADWTVERIFELARNDWLRALRLSPDRRRLAGVLSDRSVRVWNVENGEVVATVAPEYSGLPEWHDVGTRLWLLSSAGRVTRWNLVTGALEYDQTLALDGANLVRALWLPDRSGVLLSLGDVGLELWRLDRPERVVRYTRELGRACFAMALAPGNDRLVLGRYDATLAVAGLPFFLETRPAGPGEIVVTARGPTGPLHWETRGDTGAWEPVPDHIGPELTLSATSGHRWVRAGLANIGKTSAPEGCPDQ